ncbi:MAG: GntR family transcriptional regulator [Pseudomonadota bacterium]
MSEGAGTRAETAYGELKRRVLNNAFPAGAYVLEQELADLLQMSRTPIREALVRLSNEGLVEIRPRHGMRVIPISAADMAEIYTILTALEAEVAAEVARRGLTPAERAALRGAVAAMDAALEAEDLDAWAAADADFHAHLVAASANRRLRSAILQYWEQAHRVRMVTLRLRPKPVQSTQEHHALVDALEANDPAQAAKLHRAHRERAATLLAEILKTLGSPAL